ncbi:hypothetical protein IQ268_16755 [Oculatella sp. LEGE 06141]|uniref:hypothetical protein n=1 Tax=Oculatella sp. LEGE 06141 TaxID=1828648 RepID=UPI0018809C02|nr:hypothetical protein [Oculatella sp. LEGE 06141]MBE9180215.1 hypothetical protein [Oculatella sp. LEGE 06141]
MSRSPEDFRPVNPNLGLHPNVGPFPADQILPWIAIAGGSYYLFKQLLGFTWLWTGMLAAWGIATWWVLTGSKSWRFLSKFIGTPFWVRGYGRYRQIIDD